MSFDVHLMKFKNGEPSPYNAAAARAVIDSTQHTEADQFGCMSVTLSDGLEFELFLGQDESERGSFMFALRGFSETLVDFMYRLGCTDTFILIAPSEEECVILFEGAESSDLPEDLQEWMLESISSAEELAHKLLPDFSGWADWVDSAPWSQ